MEIGKGSAWLSMSRALEGMGRNSEGIARAGEAIHTTTMAVLNGPSVLPTDRVEVRSPTDLEDAVIDLKLSRHGYSANLRVVRASDEAFSSMLDMILPTTRDREG